MPSSADADQADHEQERPKGPNGVARGCEETIAELEAEKLTAPRARRRQINQRIHLLRDVLAWCKTRAGYTS